MKLGKTQLRCEKDINRVIIKKQNKLLCLFFIVTSHKTRKQIQLKKPRFCSTSFFHLYQMQIFQIYKDLSTNKALISDILQCIKFVSQFLQLFLIKPQIRMKFLIASLILLLNLFSLIYISFTTCLLTGYCLIYFCLSITIVLQKLRKLNYTIAKAYQPIALLNFIKKALEFIIAKRMSYFAKTYGFLPPNHFRAYHSSLTKHALHYLIEKVYATWDKKKIATIFLLDVTGAFNNVFKNKLLYNLQIKKINPRIVNLISSFFIDRLTILKTNEYTSEKIHISI